MRLKHAHTIKSQSDKLEILNDSTASTSSNTTASLPHADLCEDDINISSSLTENEHLPEVHFPDEIDTHPIPSNTGMNKNSSPYVTFGAKLYSFPDVSRNRANEIISDVDQLITVALNTIEEDVIKAFSSFNHANDITEKIKDSIRQQRAGLDKLKSEWLCLREFGRHKTYIPPVSFLIGERQEVIPKKGIQVLKMVSVTAEFIPIRLVLQRFFEIPGMFTETIGYMNSLMNDNALISNFIQGSLWKETILNFSGKIVLPLFLYFDDYENNNPLGSHKGISKCGAVYLSIPCLPPQVASKIENIFLFILFNTLDRKVFHNKIIFSKAMDELKYLEQHGIEINLPDMNTRIYFKLSLILGDNLGLHSLLGFVESFNASTCCRFCSIQKQQMKIVFEETDCPIRTKSSYETDLLKNNAKLTGITESCIFHAIPDFHVTKNLSVDVMHDILEGVCQYDLGKILHHFIIEKKLFTLEVANFYISGLHYGITKNKPPEILLTQLKLKKLTMSASEMLTLIRYFTLIFGCLIKLDNEYWELVIQLRQLVEMAISPLLHINASHIFQENVSEYLKLLHSLFPNSLKPKHHFLLHYSRVFLIAGPLWKISSMRFESKNREAKIISRTAVCRVNVCRTIAIKHQLRFNYRLLSNEIISTRSSFDGVQEAYLTGLPDIQSYMNVLPAAIQRSEVISTVKKLRFDGVELYKNCIIMVPSEDGPLFYQVTELFVVGKENFTIIAKLLHDIYFNYHMQSYEILTNNFEWKSIGKDDLYGCIVTHKVRVNDGKHYIVKCWS